MNTLASKTKISAHLLHYRDAICYPHFSLRLVRRVGRVAEGARLESEFTPKA